MVLFLPPHHSSPHAISSPSSDLGYQFSSVPSVQSNSCQQIADIVLLTSVLHHLLHSHNLPGATLFLDIAKAYTHVCHSFLFDALSALGASHGMVNWARILLSFTFASVHANRYELRPMPPLLTYAKVATYPPLPRCCSSPFLPPPIHPFHWLSSSPLPPCHHPTRR